MAMATNADQRKLRQIHISLQYQLESQPSTGSLDLLLGDFLASFLQIPLLIGGRVDNALSAHQQLALHHLTKRIRDELPGVRKGERTDRRTNGWPDGRMDERMNKRKDGRIDMRTRRGGQRGGQMDWQTYGWTNE